MSRELSDFKIIKKSKKNCSCGRNSYIYSLPFGLDVSVTDHLIPFGVPALDFEKTRLLKMGNIHFSITGVKKLKEIRFTIKSKKGEEMVDSFEEILVNYAENRLSIKKKD